MTSKPAVPQVAVLIPCYNEEQTIGKVVSDFLAAVPEAEIYVYDNNSTDATAARAAAAGAIVRREKRQGKGYVVRRMFADIEADVYVLVDGDDTYEAPRAGSLIELLVREELAMVVGRRVHSSKKAYRTGHVFGNELLSKAVAYIFGKQFQDILSGYRVLSRRFVKSFPSSSQGFEIETELTVHTLALELPAQEVETKYKERPAGSSSKLHTYRDGLQVVWKIIALFKNERPLSFFSTIGAVMFALAVILAWPVVATFIETGRVPRFPTAILATGLTLSGFLSVSCGLVLDAVAKGRREVKLLHYLRTRNHTSRP